MNWFGKAAYISGDMAPTLEGGRKKCSRPKFSNDFFSISAPNISDDLFFSHVLFVFVCLYVSLQSEISYITYMTDCMTPFFLTKNLDFRQKYSSLTPFLVSPYNASHPVTALLKILGGRMHGPPPPQIGDGPSPFPLSLRPCLYISYSMITLMKTVDYH